MKRFNLTLFMLMASVILFFTLNVSATNGSPMVLGNVEVTGLALVKAMGQDVNVLVCDEMRNCDVNLAELGGTAATCVDVTVSSLNMSATTRLGATSSYAASVILDQNESQNQTESKYSLGVTWANKMESLQFSQMIESAAPISTQEMNPQFAFTLPNPFNGGRVAARTHQRV